MAGIKAHAVGEVKDVKPILDGIELEDIHDPADPYSGGQPFPEPSEPGSVGDQIFRPENESRKSKSMFILKVLIGLAVVVVLIVAIACAVIFLDRSNTAGPTTVPVPTGSTAAPTLLPGVVVGDINVGVSATLVGLEFDPDYDDPSSEKYRTLEAATTTGIEEEFQQSDVSNFVQSVTLVDVRPGSVICDISITFSGGVANGVAGDVGAGDTASDVQLAVANEVAMASNAAVASALSNNADLGTGEVNVTVNDVTVPVSVDGVDLPPDITPGDPCPDDQFRCTDGTCIDNTLVCNYYYTCPSGEDELSCGPCKEGEWTCSDSKCIPSYWRCDFYVDCAGDEVNCGQDNPVVFVTLQDDIPRLFTSPGYPNHYAPKENLFWSITTLSSDRVILVNVIDFDLSLESFLAFGTEGDIGSSANSTAVFYHRLEPRQFLLDSNWAWMGFYPGRYGYSRGFSLEMTAIEKSAFTPGTCQPGEFQCATDGECILSDWRCDNFRDCAGGEDEESCDTHPPAGSCTVGNHQFQCNDGTCIHGNYVCDYIVDCSEAEEEVGCPCDQPGDYLCPEGVCIPSYFVCDWYPDCFDRSDEASCGSDNTTETFALRVGDTINITSPNYPGNFEPNQYYVYILQTNVGGRIELSISEFEVEIGGFLTIGNGDDPTNFNAALITYQYNSNPTSVTSDSFIMWVEIHSGSHGFGRFFATAVATSLECEPDQYQCPERCIPGSFQCDVWHDCNYGEDELECGHGNKSTDFILSSNTQVTFSSPNFPAPYVGSFYSTYWTFTADVEGDFVIHFVFHPYNISDTSHIAFGSGLDFSNQSSLFNLAIGRTDLHNVYSPGKLAWVTFLNGWSEEAYPGFSATAMVQPADAVPPMPSGCTRDQYDCGDGGQCIPGEYQCDDIHDCFNEGRDEQFCDFCTRFQFACPEKCIPSYFRCDFYHDCVNGEDEQGCGWDAIIEDRTFSAQQTLEFTSPLYPDPYPGNFSDFHYSFMVTDPAYHVLFDFNSFSVDDLAVLIFGAGLDPSNFSSTLAIYHARDVPMRVYVPASKVWVTFAAGIEPGEGFQATVSAYTAGAIPPVTCAANQWACVDGQTCIPESYRCDGYHDCPSNGEDEHGCASACREYQFECRNGECLFEHRHCNGIADCSEGEDEVGCYDIGPCSPFQYQCANGVCIPEQQACDYFFDCPDGSDEFPSVCGECNALDEFSCDFGNCIPSYWVCDFYYDCLGGEDEFYCENRHGAGKTTLAMHERYNITSPNWPDTPDPNIYQLWQISGPEGTVIHFDFLDYDLGLQSFLVVFDGHDVSNHSTAFAHSFYRFNPVILLSHTNQVSIAYHSGEYVGTRGFYISMVAVNPDHHQHPDCEDTAYQCAEDGECIPEYYYCDGFYDCLTGDDEYNCTYPEPGTCGTYSSEYQCQGTDICIHADFRCDYRSDCPEHDDEFNCTCKEGEFSCPGTGQCLPAHLVCDFYYDCINSTADELACPEPELMLYQPNETQIITIQSPNYPNNYDARSYIVYLLQGPQDYRFIVRFDEYDVDWKGFLTFGSTLDYDDHDNAFSVYNHHDEPNMLYTPTNTFYIQFYGGPYGRSRGFQLTVQAVSIEDVPTQPPVPTCPAGDFTCFDGTCLPGIFECDGLTDCSPQGEDEHKCFASGGGCRSHQFTCNNGQCIHSDWRCDGISDCSLGEDEEGCPFQCFGVSQYTCVQSEECIPSFFQCDYYPDCTFGEDETDCGECTEGYFNCSDGACVPDYYVCDAYYDCLTRADEMNCGTPMNTNHIVLEEGEQHQIQSPGYPNMHDSLCYYLWIVTVPEGLYVHVIFQAFSVSIHTYMSLGSGSDPDNTTTRFAVYYHRTAPRETVIPSSVAWIGYHCGVYGDGRGFDVIIRPTNISTHVFPDCELGEVQCFDGHCIPSHFLCDTIRDCSMGEDEGHSALINCTTYTDGACGNHETEFQCNDDACVHADYLCDNVRDCAEAEDELNCARNCTEFEFECPGGQCIPETERCDAYLNCIGGIDDELNCGTPNNSVYIYLYLNSTNITSMNYPRPYPKNEYTVTYVATEPGYVIRATFNDLDLSVRSFLFFGNGDDISDFSNIFDGYTHRTAFPPFIQSAGNQLYMEFHSGFYGGSRGYHIQFEAVDSADSVVTFPPCADGEFQCTNDGTCIRGDFECDLYHDCGDSSDEENCQAVGGTCQPHQFTCNDGQCIHESWECDGFADCSGAEDEASCGTCLPHDFVCDNGRCIASGLQCNFFDECGDGSDEDGCPFGCPLPDQFACNRSEECIFRSQRCNYIANCQYGEDEEGCECPEGFYVCSNGGCIPPYYVCDGLPDCFDGQDERNCSGQGTAVTTSITLTDTSMVNVTSPNFPGPYGVGCYNLWQFTAPPGLAVRFHFRSFELSINSYLSIGSGPDPDNVTSILADYHYRYRPRERVVPDNEAWLEFHCGSFAGSRGFHIEVSAVDPSSHVHVECQTGEYRCTDNSCIPTFDLCNGVKNCPLAEDENENCANFSHNECGTHDDEWQCSFYCIHGYNRCDGFVDCILDLSDELNCNCVDGSDELGCGHANNTAFVNITQDDQMVNISSPGYPDYAPAQDFTVTYVTVPEGQVVHATILDSEIATTAKIVFSDGHDDNKIFLEWVGHGSDVTNVTSFTNRMMIEFHTGFDGYSQFFISLSSAIPPEPMCTEEQFACIDRTCIPEIRECDGYPHCVNGEDEANCSAEGGTCAPHLFTCDDGRCITNSYRCDGYDDCDNGEDEQLSLCDVTTDVP
ncbi:uncharacterized protein [Diadema setosum]|uniref:uncharacterized protein n=1 Tax=Diadema setosum TaxID=31175 RepID=UPI003B3A8BB1